jgi:hypothetical protein
VKKIQSLRELIPRSQEAAAAVALKYRGLYVFGAPLKYIDFYERVIYFHLIGGRCNKGEAWADAAQREASEEISETVSLVPAGVTRLVTSDGREQRILLSDSPRPFCVYKRTAADDRGFYQKSVRWVVAYRSRPLKMSVRPHAELAFVLYLTAEMLRRALDGSLSYKQVAFTRDGSTIVLRRGVRLDHSALAIPAGAAAVLARQPEKE